MPLKRFYHDCYLKTGWLAMQPLAHSLNVGDVCQLRQGRLQPLLSVVDTHLVECLGISPPIALDPSDWKLSGNVQQIFCETLWAEGDDGERSVFTKQALEFERAGGYLFSTQEVQARLLTNWHQIRDEVTLKLTQMHYAFRDVFVVTGVTQASEWGLAVAGQPGARLEMSTALGNSDHHALFGHGSARVQQSQGMAVLEQSQGRLACFFKAKKMVLSDAMYDRFLGQLLENPAHLRPAEIANWLGAPLLNLIKSNELNLNTCIDFFSWADLSFDDLERLCG